MVKLTIEILKLLLGFMQSSSLSLSIILLVRSHMQLMHALLFLLLGFIDLFHLVFVHLSMSDPRCTTLLGPLKLFRRTLGDHVLRAFVAISPFLDSFSELLLLSSDELLSLDRLFDADGLQIVKFGHFLLCLTLLLVGKTLLPLALLNLDILRAVLLLFLLQAVIVQGATVQVVLRDTSQIGIVIDLIVPIDLLLVAWHI